MSRAMQNQNQLMDLMKANMMMNSKDNPIMTLLTLTFLEVIIKYINLILEGIKSSFDGYVNRKFRSTMNNLPITDSKSDSCEIIFERKYGKGRGDDYITIDAVLNRVMMVPNVKRIIFARSTYLVNYDEVFRIEKDICFQLMESTQDSEGDIDTLKFRIFTDENNSEYLRQFVKTCVHDYEVKKKNMLGNDMFYFDHILSKKDQFGNELDNNKIFFSRNLFTTNRNLENVFFEQKKEVETRLDLFINNETWYNKRGIPHTLGFLLHGSPGTGKTSTIKAIANLTNRHIININLGKVKTKTQLKQLFFDEKIHVMEKAEMGENCMSYVIPLNKRLYVMEDIDAVEGSLLLRRDINIDDESESEESPPVILKPNRETNVKSNKIESTNKLTTLTKNLTNDDILNIQEANKPENELNTLLEGYNINKSSTNMQSELSDPNNSIGFQYQKKKKEEEDEDNIDKDDKLDLSAILNILDGTLETPGRIIIITSNYPEKLDHALIRPGRIDMILEFKKANHQIISELYECFFEQPSREQSIKDIKEYEWTPAEVSQIMFKNYREPKQAIDDLIENEPHEYFKFSYFDKDNSSDED